MPEIINGFNKIAYDLLVEELKIFSLFNKKNINRLFFNKYKGKVKEIFSKVSRVNNFETNNGKNIFDLISEKEPLSISNDKIIGKIIKKINYNYFENKRNTNISYLIIDTIYFHYFNKKHLTYCQKSDFIYEKIILDIKDILEKISFEDLDSINYLKKVFSENDNYKKIEVEDVIKKVINKNILKMNLTNDLLFILIIIYIDSLNIFKLNKEIKYILLSQFILFKRNSQNRKFFPSYKKTLSFKCSYDKKESYNKKREKYLKLSKMIKVIKRDLKIKTKKVLETNSEINKLDKKINNLFSLKKEKNKESRNIKQKIKYLDKKINKLNNNLSKLKDISFKKSRVINRIKELEKEINIYREKYYKNKIEFKKTNNKLLSIDKDIYNIKLKLKKNNIDLNKLLNEKNILESNLEKLINKKNYLALKSKKIINNIWNEKYKLKNGALKNIILFDYDEIIYIERLLEEIKTYGIYNDKIINEYNGKLIQVYFKKNKQLIINKINLADK